MAKSVASMFEAMKGSFKSKEPTKKEFPLNDSNRMSFEKGKTYKVRLIPYIDDENQENNHFIFEYKSNSWKSKKTGKQTFFLSPKTFDPAARCPISEKRLKIYNDFGKDSKENEEAKIMNTKTNWLVNAYVIEDPTNPDNVGTVKIINMGSTLHKILENSTLGEDAEEFGFRCFDISEAGCDLRIKCEDDGSAAPDFALSRFMSPSKIPGMTDKKIEEIYSKAYNLKTIFELPAMEYLETAVDVHFYGKDGKENGSKNAEESPKSSTKNSLDEQNSTTKNTSKILDDEEDDIPMEHSAKKTLKEEISDESDEEDEISMKSSVQEEVKKESLKTVKKTTTSNNRFASLLEGLED